MNDQQRGLGVNGNQPPDAGWHEDELHSVRSAISALLDDVTVASYQRTGHPTSALPTLSLLPSATDAANEPGAPVASPWANPEPVAYAPAEPLSSLQRPIEQPTQSDPLAAFSSPAPVSPVQRPPWELDDELPPFPAPLAEPVLPPSAATQPQPAWTIPASLFEPATPAPQRAEAQVAGPQPADSRTDFYGGPAAVALAIASQPDAADAPPPAVEQVAPSPTPTIDPSAISIRGRNDGVSIEIGAGRWEDLTVALTRRLDQAAGFFRGGHIAVDVGARTLLEPELKTLYDILNEHGMEPSVLRTISERTFQSALALGISVTHETKEGPPLTVAHKAAVSDDRHSYFVYRGNLRSGQVLNRHDHVVVIGDVNPGAEVISDGDVMVWGRLRGLAHAGAKGNGKSIIAALDLDPVQLRIDKIIVAAPGNHSENGSRRQSGKSEHKRPEIARLVDERLVIEAWDEARVMGSPLLKRLRD